MRIGAFQLLHFLFENLGNLFPPFLFCSLFPQVVNVFHVLGKAQFVLDGLELVTQIIFFLLLINFTANLLMYLFLELEQFQVFV